MSTNIQESEFYFSELGEEGRESGTVTLIPRKYQKGKRRHNIAKNKDRKEK